MLSKEQLLFYNEQGLIPGPGESSADFEKRALYCEHFKDKLLKVLPKSEPFLEGKPSLKGVFDKTKSLYGIAPHWIPLFFSNEKLLPWHGGAAWIFQEEDDYPTCAFLQLRKELGQKKSYLGLVNRDELIAHEFSHVGRMMFEEPKFEEILAYRASHSWLAKSLGPLVQNSFESGLFMLLILLLFLVDMGILIWGTPAQFWSAFPYKLLPLGLILFAFIRLAYRKYLFNKVLQKLNTLFQKKGIANAVIYRLTDSEIVAFSKFSFSEIQTYIDKAEELRWDVIRNYLSK